MSNRSQGWTQGLNPEQARAVEHSFGPLLILAGAGSGKTTVLVARTGRMLASGVAKKPEEICVLTFTNKAARELKHRVAKRLGDRGSKIWAGTFHSFGLQILRKNHKAANLPNFFGVIDQGDSQAILRELLKETRVVGKEKFDLEKILNLVQNLRVGPQKTEAFDEYHEIAELLLPKYLKKLDVLGVVDFESLLLKPLELFKEHPEILKGIQEQLQFLMVDEFQDTNQTQMKLIDLIAKVHRNLAVVGDDDQSIYGWRGAQVRNILDFPKQYPPCEVIKLERNYRSSSSILEVANRLIEKNRHRHGKILRPEKKVLNDKLPEVFLIESEEEEAEFIIREIRERMQAGVKGSEIAILYRSNSQSGLLESLLRQNRVAYSVSGGTAFFDRKEIKDIVAYLRFAISPNDVSLRRIINTPTRGIGDHSVEKIIEFSKHHNLNFTQACRRWQEIELPDKTGHSIEALLTFMAGLPARLMSPSNAEKPGDMLLAALAEIHYKDFLYSSSSEPHIADKRWQLVEIFSRVLTSFALKGGFTEKTLREFVDAMELRDDGSDEKDSEQVSLMTLHACKGLEFPYVYILGVEEDLLPHKTLGSDVDEERRLFYVGITRAQDSLTMSYCKSRTRYGQKRPVTPSRFLLEIPKNLVQFHNEPFRPVSEAQRETLVTDFLASLRGK